MLALGAAALVLGAGQPAAAQDKGTIYCMIPTLLDEFQTESQKAIEGVLGKMDYEVVSISPEEIGILVTGAGLNVDGGLLSDRSRPASALPGGPR